MFSSILFFVLIINCEAQFKISVKRAKRPLRRGYPFFIDFILVFCFFIPNQKFIVLGTLRMIGIHRSSDDGHRRPSSAFQSFPMPEVPLSRCWPSSEMPGILLFQIVGIPIKACTAQLSFNVFPLTNQYCHH